MKTKFSKSVSLFLSAIMAVSASSLSGFITNAETNSIVEQTASQDNLIKADAAVEKSVSDPDENSDNSNNEKTPERNNVIEGGEGDIYTIDGVSGVCGVAENEKGVIILDENDKLIPTVFFTISKDVCYINGDGVINQRDNIPKEVKKIVINDPEVKFQDSCTFGGTPFESFDLSHFFEI